MSDTNTQQRERAPGLDPGEARIPVSSAPTTPPLAQLDAQLRAMMRRLGEARSAHAKSIQEARDELRGLLLGLLDAVDAFDRALDRQRDPESGRPAPGLRSFQTARQLLERALSDHGVTQVRAEPGELFDPHRHRVSDTREAGDRVEGEIAELASAGWRWRDEWLRKPAVVVVRAAQGDPPQPESDAPRGER